MRRQTTRRSRAFRVVGAGATRDRQGARSSSLLLMSLPQRKQYRSTSFFRLKLKNGALRAQPRQQLLEIHNDWGAADARTSIVRTTPPTSPALHTAASLATGSNCSYHVRGGLHSQFLALLQTFNASSSNVKFWALRAHCVSADCQLLGQWAR